MASRSGSLDRMELIGVRALGARASAVVRRVAAGETFTVTNRGRPVARIVPIKTRPAQGRSVIERMVAAGEADPPADRPDLLALVPTSPAPIDLPANLSIMEWMIATGAADPPQEDGDLLDLLPMKPRPGVPLPSVILAQLREHER